MVASDTVAEHIRALKDEDWGVREDAARALGVCRDPRSVRPLIEALHDTDRAVRDAATEALMAIGEPAVEDVGRSLYDPNMAVQEAAASILATIGDERVIAPLRTALCSPDWVVRMHAARALGRLKAVEAVGTLILLLQDPVPTVRQESVHALQAIGRPAVRTLLQSLHDRDWRVRLRATEALGILGSAEAVDPLIMLLQHDPDIAVRQDAARALGQLGNTRAVEPLLHAMAESRLRAVVIEALGQLKDRRAVPALVALVKTFNASEYEGRMPACLDDRYKQELVQIEAAIRALAHIGDPDTIPLLVSALQSTLIRAEAAEALTAFGQSAVPVLVNRLKIEQDHNIRFHIQEALARLGWHPGRRRF
ncbi:MAG: HEAT repeat domain-containing protein [Nitrospirae bacterium]|nr:MAG: HEAT repeat domain-containing protein [Nitrospirota bacterium]